MPPPPARIATTAGQTSHDRTCSVVTPAAFRGLPARKDVAQRRARTKQASARHRREIGDRARQGDGRTPATRQAGGDLGTRMRLGLSDQHELVVLPRVLIAGVGALAPFGKLQARQMEDVFRELLIG